MLVYVVWLVRHHHEQETALGFVDESVERIADDNAKRDDER